MRVASRALGRYGRCGAQWARGPPLKMTVSGESMRARDAGSAAQPAESDSQSPSTLPQVAQTGCGGLLS